MSVFSELLFKINEIPNGFSASIKDDLKSALQSLSDFETEFINEKTKARELAKKAKLLTTTLQSINEDDDDSNKAPEKQTRERKSSRSSATSVQSSKNAVLEEQKGNTKPKRVSKKRSKDEVDDMLSPEQDKRPKRNASVRAQSNISKQVNVNLTQKMRREEKPEKERSSRRRRGDDKENDVPAIQIKQEKVSLQPEEAMDSETLPIAEVKKEMDVAIMPPPAMPAPKPRGRQAKDKNKDENKDKDKDKTDEVEETGRRRTRRKQTDASPPPVPRARSTRASARNNSTVEEPAPTEARPKRTRAKKKVSEPRQSEIEKETPIENNVIASPSEKPRPKRTRRGKAAEKQKSEEKPQEPEMLSPKEERISVPVEDVPSPILAKEKVVLVKETKEIPEQKQTPSEEDTEKTREQEKTSSVEEKMQELDATVVLPQGKYHHAHSTPNANHMNETVVLESHNRGTIVLEKAPNKIMDSTIVIQKGPPDVSEDDSLMTNDESDVRSPATPPHAPKMNQPTSAVKEKVQQFEELASRVTRTKTRAMAKQGEDTETHTPPDKISKPILSADTLHKMNSLIFNGKQQPQISSSASKPRAIPTIKPTVTNSSSKLTTINKLREEELAKEKEDARSKKEALLEARRELQKKKREEKMAAAAAAREQAEKERIVAIQAAQRGRREKQQTADLGRAERLREAERKKIELARKVAETEERRRLEERARQQKLAEDQRRAEQARRKQQEDAEAVKKEAAMMAREIEKRQKEYIEKQKLKQKMEAEKMATPNRNLYSQMEPVYMKDGFEHLNSDEDEDTRPPKPAPAWSTTRVRNVQLSIQAHIKQTHVDRLFSVRVHSPDLREIFPEIDRRVLKRTSSAVWRTPERLPVLKE